MSYLGDTISARTHVHKTIQAHGYISDPSSLEQQMAFYGESFTCPRN